MVKLRLVLNVFSGSPDKIIKGFDSIKEYCRKMSKSSLPACYSIHKDGQCLYVGSSVNVFKRINSYTTFRITAYNTKLYEFYKANGLFDEVRIYECYRYYIRENEVKLILDLKPRFNIEIGCKYYRNYVNTVHDAVA